ncbi:MAG TPA: MFS transporter [Ktedonobacteraceae bacterium]|nr:MFS transporter [Ktedonobacteraceae bacterium]
MIVKQQMLSNLLAPLRVRDFRLLFIGQMVSTIGDMFYAVALPWLMLNSGHTPQELGIVLAAYGVPRVGTLLLGGLLSDWLRPRRVMLLADIMRAVLVAALVALVLSGRTQVLPLSVVAAPLGAFAGLFLPAYYAVLPEVLDEDALQAGNALNTSTLQLALLIGSGLAGLVVSRLSPAAAFVVDALTFVVSAFTLALMRARPQPEKALATDQSSTQESEEESKRKPAFAPEITFWQLLRSWRLLQVAFLVIVFGNFLFNGLFEVALPTLARNQFMAGPGGYGLLLAMFGGGSLLGGLAAGGLGQLRRRGLLLLSLIMLLGVLYSLVPFAGGLPGAALLIACAGFSNGMLTVLAFTIMQQQSPPHLLGRLLGMFLFASLGLYPLSVALVGVLSSRIGPVIIFPISGAMMLLASAFGWLQRDVRQL